eukprot:TRINITY_DN217_c0_g1_i4.p1 TRINITY_DN217_c0_g1~~TRINITY_DN217_c0_g1_i4.p1  ORF type:complete len:221 (+),score=36.55 TRINITY_DN217_c0_g1_i4:201-863(+)
MCIRDRYQRRVRGIRLHTMEPPPEEYRPNATRDGKERTEAHSSVSAPENANTNRSQRPPAAVRSERVSERRESACMDVCRAGKKSDDGSNSENDAVADEDKRVTVWNPITGKKLSGNASPFRRNLHKYLAAHPDWEECPDAGETKKRRKPSSTSLMASKKSKLDDCDMGACPLYLWDCLVAVAHAHQKNEEEWKGQPHENIPSPSTPVTIPCRFTLSTAG